MTRVLDLACTTLGCAVLAALAVGCASGGARDGGTRDGSGVRPDVPIALDAPASDAASDGGPRDAPLGIDTGATDAGDSGARDGGRDAGGGTTLDPRLDVPAATNEPCSAPGNLSECSGIAVCRFFSPTEGRCESCSSCGNLFDPCSSGEDCDILFVCFEGQCTNFCTLGSFECGAPTDCIDVGHPTRGACRPGF